MTARRGETVERSLWLVGNWKMWPASAREARDTLRRLSRVEFPRAPNLTYAVAPPAPFLPIVREALPRRWLLAAQDAGMVVAEGEETGAYSLAMLESLGVRLVIVGHSEARARGVSDATVAEQVAAAARAGCEVVVCVGERQRKDDNEHFAFVREQVRAAIAHLKPQEATRLRVAYEPVWAIGSRAKATPRPSDVHEMALWIKKTLAERYGPAIALATPVLYGGSVHPDNALAFARDGGVDGLLVGRASRTPREFAAIARALLTGVGARVA